MKDLNDFLNIVSAGKKEIEETPKPKKITSSLFDNLKGDSFLSILESEMKVVKEQEKKQ